MNQVTVVIVHWNNPTHLQRCLRALLGQSVRPQSIIVVDNASDDSPRHLVGQFPQVLWKWNERNLGFATAVNQAIKLVQTEWVATVNPDAFVDSRWLEELLRGAAEHPGFSFFASTLLRPDGRIDGAGDAFHVSGLAWRRLHGQPASRIPGQPAEVFSACAAAALFRRQVIEDVGGMDPRFFCYFEDVDLAIRLRQAGHRCLYVPEAKALHVGGGSGVARDVQVYYGHRNLIWTYWKSVPVGSWQSLVHLPMHLAYQAITLCWHCWNGQALAIFRAKWDGLVGALRFRRSTHRFPLEMAETGWLTPLRK